METFVKIILVTFVTFVIEFIFAYPFMLLWNWLMPVIFGLGSITYMQALGILLLCDFIFKTNFEYKDK